MTDPSIGELDRRLNSTVVALGARIDDTMRQVGSDLSRHERRVSDLESHGRSSTATNDAKYVNDALYLRDLAETKKDHSELVAEVRSLKLTLDNNRRLVLTSLVLPVLVALIVFFLTTQVNR